MKELEKGQNVLFFEEYKFFYFEHLNMRYEKEDNKDEEEEEEEDEKMEQVDAIIEKLLSVKG